MKRTHLVTIYLLLMLATLGLFGCGAETRADRDTLDERVAALETEVATFKANNATPGALGVMAPTAEAAPTSTPELAAPTPTPEANPAVLMPTATPAAVSAPTTNQVVNLRMGPGLDSDQVGSTTPGAPLTMVAQSADGVWVQLDDGSWLAAEYVVNLPADLPGVDPSESATASQDSPATLPNTPASAYNRHMVGNAQPPLPPAGDNDFDVIVLKRDDNMLWVFLRNNTNEPAYSMGVDVVARAADGSMLGTTDSSGSEPRLVYPGEVTYNTVHFGDLVLPPDAQFDFDVTARRATAGEGYGDFTITEHNLVQNRFVGMATNSSAKEASLIEAILLCFDSSGNFLEEHSEFTPKNSAEAGAVVPYEVGLDGASCPTYLLWVAGLSF